MSEHPIPRRTLRRGACLVLAIVSSAVVADAQPRTTTVVAGERYKRAPAGQEWMLGRSYRDLWATPIEVEILDLETEAGGLRPVMRVGGLQTLSLALAGEDGRAYTFRSLDKSMGGVIPEEFLGTGVEDIAQDQTSSALPGGALIVPPLAEAAGVLHSPAQLVVLPDSPRLGEFQESFAGALGVFLVFPTPGFHAATEVLSPEEMLERWSAGPDGVVDNEAFLRARLLDMFIGDWDRHYKQYRWARVPGKDHLQPIPEDRDQAFSSYDGLAMSLAGVNGSQLAAFEDEYSSIEQMTTNGADHDRFILAELTRSVWMAIASDVQASLTDDVIRTAVGRLPPEYFALRGGELINRLEMRRDKLLEVAESYYEWLAVALDIHCTDQTEEIVVENVQGGDLVVKIFTRGVDTPYFERRLDADETDEVRIYTVGGGDSVVTQGTGSSPIQVRIISGPESDAVENARGIRYYNDEDRSERIPSGNAPVSGSSWTPDNLSMPGSPARDTGQVVRPLAVFGYHPDPGVILGAGVEIQKFGFRKQPWAQRHVIRGGFGFEAKEAFFDYDADFPREERKLHFSFVTRASGLDQLRYYGLGNETKNDRDDDVYRISNMQVTLFPALTLDDGPRGFWKLGPVLRYSDTGRTRSDTLLAEEQPYGIGSFGEVGLATVYTLETRDPKNALDDGVSVRFQGSLYPEAWDVRETFGEIEADLSGHIALGRPVLLSLFAGGKKLWGEYPFFEAAYVGGFETMDGYNWNRFAGDASLFGSVELRWAFQKIRFTVPGEIGLTFRGDVGRVFLDGEDSNRWHSSGSIGIFYAPFRRLMLFEAGLGRSPENTFFYVRGRMRFLE